MTDRIARMKEERRKEILDLIGSHNGNVSALCQDLGIARSTFYRYHNDYPEIAEALEEQREDVGERIEHKLIEKALQGDNTAMIFFLKTRRGWTESRRIEMDATVEDRRIEKDSEQWKEFEQMMDAWAGSGSEDDDEEEDHEDDKAPF